MKKIRVLHTEWSGGWGGQEIRILKEMLCVREHGIEVFVASTAHAKITVQARIHNIPVFTLPFRGNGDLKTIYGLYKIIKQHKIDIVNTHSGKDTWVGGIAAKLAGAKFIRTRHLSNRVCASRINFIYQLCDFIITSGESVCKDMVKYNRIKPEKLISIPTGADESNYDSSKYQRLEMRRKFGIADHEIAIGILAILRHFKRHDLFIEMAKELSQRYDNLKFFIAGDGPMRNEILDRIKAAGLTNKIILTGFLHNPAELLAALDIFTLTSDGFETTPQVITQAMMMEVPIVAANVGSVSTFNKNNNIILIEPGKVEPLVAAVESLITDPDKRESLKANREFAIDHFSDKVMTSKVLAVYQQLLGPQCQA